MSNHTLLAETAEAVRAFAAGQSDLETLQAKLQSVMTLLERTEDVSETARVMSNVEGDLEFIRFTVFGDEVHPAAMAALEPLLPLLPQPERQVE